MARPAGERPPNRQAGPKDLKSSFSILIIDQKFVFLAKQAVYELLLGKQH